MNNELGPFRERVQFPLPPTSKIPAFQKQIGICKQSTIRPTKKTLAVPLVYARSCRTLHKPFHLCAPLFPVHEL